jgi:hypothetical protein
VQLYFAASGSRLIEFHATSIISRCSVYEPLQIGLRILLEKREICGYI